MSNPMDSAGAKSVMSNDMEELTSGREDISHQVQGHKANLSNPSKFTTIYNYIHEKLNH
jgi:Conidiation protein 6